MSAALADHEPTRRSGRPRLQEPPDAGEPAAAGPEPLDAAGALVDGVTARWRPHQFTEARAQALGVDLRRWPIVAPAPGWQEDASCRGTSVEVADAMSDAISQRQATELVGRFCSRCPVIRECYNFGRATRGWGVHGGIVLRAGKLATWRTAAERSRRSTAEDAEDTVPTDGTVESGTTEPTDGTAPTDGTVESGTTEPTESTYILPTTPTEATEPTNQRRGQRSQPRRLTRARRRGRRVAIAWMG